MFGSIVDLFLGEPEWRQDSDGNWKYTRESGGDTDWDVFANIAKRNKNNPNGFIKEYLEFLNEDWDESWKGEYKFNESKRREFELALKEFNSLKNSDIICFLSVFPSVFEALYKRSSDDLLMDRVDTKSIWENIIDECFPYVEN